MIMKGNKMLKNYTSTVPASRSIQHIENQLVQHGAINILKEYSNDGKLTALCFILNIKDKQIPFKIPARIENCEKILKARIKRHTTSAIKRVKEQAERTAWKLLSDWIDVNIGLEKIGQVELMEIFLSYVYDVSSKQTYFEKLKERNYKGLIGTGTN